MFRKWESSENQSAAATSPSKKVLITLVTEAHIHLMIRGVSSHCLKGGTIKRSVTGLIGTQVFIIKTEKGKKKVIMENLDLEAAGIMRSLLPLSYLCTRFLLTRTEHTDKIKLFSSIRVIHVCKNICFLLLLGPLNSGGLWCPLSHMSKTQTTC